ncbi:MAG: Ig-like domain-containing protein [Prevotella sp.]|nr:Ig-like domain-containing protein [Prevotella sp.]
MNIKHLRLMLLSMIAILCGGSMYAQSTGTVKEKAIIDTDFQDWPKGSSATITTNFSNETINFNMENATVDPNATNDGKFNSADDPAYRGYIMCEKKASTVTTTTFKNITRIRYRHGATGSNRGWGLKIKVGDGDWEVINDVKISSPVWVEKEINKENVQLQWYNLNESQNAYMFELEIYANVESTAKQVKLTTAVSPENAGTVTVKPFAVEYDENTDLTLTAEKNFGYQFKQWTKDGQVIGTNATLNYTITENSTIVAEFEPMTTYELNLTVEGSNDYMVTLSPAPTVIDGKNMYEEGQTVVLTANQYEGLVTFNNWNDGDTKSEKTVTMTKNVTLTATYAQADIIAGWDFYLAGNNGRKADFASQDNEAAALSLVNTETGETSGWLDKSTIADGGYEGFKGAAVNWREGTQNGDVGHWHWQTKINAEAYTDINIQFQMLYNYNAYQTYQVEYSLNGTDWTNVGSISMEGAKNAASFNSTLPAAANNQKDLYIRMIADKSSSIDGTASSKDGNALAMFFITGTAKLVDDGQAPKLVNSVPAEGATGVSANGKIVLTFDERVKLTDEAVAYVNNTYIKSNTQNPTKGIVNGKTITFEYKGLEYATLHNFVLAAKTVADLTDNYITEPINISFTTMERPSVTKGIYDAVVENVDQLLAAFKAADERSDKNVRFRIFLKKGTYQLPQGTGDVTYSLELANGSTTSVTKKDPITRINSGNISLIGESRDEVIITNTIPADETFEGKYGTASVYEGISKSDVLQTRGENLYYQDLTVSTGMDDARGRDIAVEDMGKHTIYKNVCLHGYQDTWVGQNDKGLYYFEGGVVRGRTDYMCGKGDAYFNGVELRQIAGGYAAVPSKPANIGWVYKDCVINADGSGVDGAYTLGRPWGEGTPVALFIDTKMNVVPSAIGWNEMSGGWPARFAEYNSTTSTGSEIDLSGRKKIFAETHENNPVLTAEEAAAYSDMSKMFGDWNPKLYTEQAPVPTNVKLEGSTLTWNNSNYVFCWAICKDGNVVDFTTEPTYTVSGEGTWSVRAANEMGGLSEATEANSSTGIESIDKHATNDDAIYNMQGIRVSKATKGVYIVGGRKIVKK